MAEESIQLWEVKQVALEETGQTGNSSPDFQLQGQLAHGTAMQIYQVWL